MLTLTLPLSPELHAMAAASIFICHAQPDADFARDLSVALETFRLSVWRDSHNLRGSGRLASEVPVAGSPPKFAGPSNKPSRLSWCSA